MSQVLRVGLIGLGEVAQVMHLPLMYELAQRYRIQAIYDISPSLREHVAQRYQVPEVCLSEEELLESPNVDLVFILSPDHLHRPQLLRALETGKHVFIEKPICLNMTEATQILRARTSSTTMVGYMRRFAPGFLQLKELLQTAPPIDYVHIRDVICEGPYFLRQTNSVFYPTDLPQDLLEQGRAMAHDLTAEGARTNDPVRMTAYRVLTGLGVHSLSAMRELFGYPKRVLHSSVLKNGFCVVTLFEYEGFNVLYEALIDNVVRFDAQIDVFTDTKMYQLKYDSPYVRNLPTQLTVTTSDDHQTQTLQYGPYYRDPFRVELEYLHDCIVQGHTPKTTLEDAAQDIRLVEEIARCWA